LASEKKSASGVSLPEGFTGSTFFHHVLSEAVEEYSSVLGAAEFPAKAGEFKKTYDEALARFESVRASSPERVQIAHFIVKRTQQQLRYVGSEGELPFSEYVATGREPFALQTEVMTGSERLEPRIELDGRLHRGAEIEALLENFLGRDLMTDRAAAAVRWLVTHAGETGGRIDLSGHKFVVMGAAAELSPAPLLLAAGADVLWIDVTPPDAILAKRDDFSGTLHYVQEGTDLLESPGRIVATIKAFAEADPVHLALFAYAAGASREWRLMACMNGIVRSLDPALVRTVSLLVSPTVPAVCAAQDVEAAARRLKQRPGWQSMLRSLGALPEGQLERNGLHVSRSIVPIQGLSYQAAQYVSKLLAAETYAIQGTRIDGEASPVTVSANTAAITSTRSLTQPIFQAAFIGAPRFGVEIFKPATTRWLNGLMILHDILNPKAPGNAATIARNDRERAAALLSQQVHGGLYGLPYALGPAIQISALIGMAGRPDLLFKAIFG